MLYSLLHENFVFRFGFTMGFPYKSAAALDNISIKECPPEDVPGVKLLERESVHEPATLKKLCYFRNRDTCGYQQGSTNQFGLWKLVPQEVFKEYGTMETDGKVY